MRKASRRSGGQRSAAWNRSSTFSGGHGKSLPLRFRALSYELAPQPGLGEAPIALNRCVRQSHYFRGLLDCQAAEEAKLHHLAVMRVLHRELAQRIVERNQINILVGVEPVRFTQR